LSDEIAGIKVKFITIDSINGGASELQFNKQYFGAFEEVGGERLLEWLTNRLFPNH
jgi:hypothetical protein